MYEPLAQSVEQQPFKLWVVGSIPTRLTIHFYPLRIKLCAYEDWKMNGRPATEGILPAGYAKYIFHFFDSPHRLAGLGHRPFTAVTGVRIPLGTPFLLRRLQE